MVYREVLFTEYLPDECFLIIGTYTWNLKEEIITLLDSIEGNKELVVTYLSSDKLIAKVRLDIENDGSFLVLQLLPKSLQDRQNPTIII